MTETVTRKRIEILVDTPLVSRIIRILQDAKVSGWSISHVDAGGGRDGSWQHDELTGAAAKSLVLAIASEANTGVFVDKLAPLLDSHRLLLTIGDVQVVRGERF